MADQTRRDRNDRRLSALELERSSFMPHYKTLSEFIRPRRGRFEVTDRNKGDRRHQQIINSKAIKATQVATAGMFNGVMSPTRPWFVLEDPDDPDLMDFEPVRIWFDAVRQRMMRIFNSSNLFTMAPMMILEELVFGTGLMFHLDDPVNVARFNTHTVGSYMIGQDDRMVVNTVGRKFMMTVEQVVRRFSVGNTVNPDISPHVRNLWDKSNYDTWVEVWQLIEENDNFKPSSRLSRDFRFRSWFWEPGHPDKDKFLEVSGFREFPAYAPRWELTGEDIYATNCPGMTALGDVKQLQLQERRKAQGLDKMVTPVLTGPASLAHARVQHTPGFTIAFDAAGGTQGLKPAYDVRLPLDALTIDMEKVEQRIDEAFFVDLFKAISAMRGIQPRNELELVQRDQERLVELGPVLERQFGDFLEPMIDRTFNQMVRVPGLVPPPPPELQNRQLKPRFVSVLALAQQAAVTGSIDQLVVRLNSLVPLKPEVVDKFDADQAFEEYAKIIGTPARVVIDDKIVAQTRKARAEAQAQAQELAATQQVAETARTASETSTDEGNLLSDGIEAATGG